MKPQYLAAAALGLALALPAMAADGPELHISSKGEVHIIGVELTTVNALNLFGVNVWGLRWSIPIDKWVVLESADGKGIAVADIRQGHRLEIKGQANPDRSGWLDTRLIRDLSIGTPAPSVPPPQTANIGAAVTPTPPPTAPAPSTGPAGSPQARSPRPELGTKAGQAPAPAPAPSTGGPLTQTLRLGMRGGEVIVLQEFLQKNGWGIPDDGPVTGYYGKVTVNAVKKFQAANGLPPEGEVGPKTRVAINNLLSGRP